MYDNKKNYILIILLIVIFYNQIIDCTIINNKTIRSSNKNRIKSGQSPWHLLICLSHSQSPTKNDVQRAWETVRMESLQNELDVSYIEGRMTTIIETSSYPLALINKFCNEIENGKTILNIVIGGGSAARFIITASDSISLPSLWLPMTHRDFLRQGKRGNYETRLGAGSEEAGAAAAALMDKANWHAFTLLIDTTILPIKYLLKKNNLDKLTPRTIVYLPASDKSIKLRLKIISEAGGSGGVLVMACDLNNAKKILSVAGKYQMLNGRFLWLWLDLKAELKPNEPGLVNTQSIQHNSLTSITNNNNNNNNKQMISDNNILKNNGKLEINDNEQHLSLLSNLMHDINSLQDYKWKDDQKIIKKRDDKTFINDNNDDDDDDDDDDSTLNNNSKHLNSKTFMPIGMLALRPSSIKLSSNGDAILTRMLRETSQALDSTFIEYKNIIKKLREQQLKENFIPSCFFEGKNKYNYLDIKNNISKSLTYKLRNSMKQISYDKSEFQLLNLQAIQYPGNKTQLRWTKVGLIRGGKDVHLDTITWPGGGIVPAYLDQGGEKIGMPVYRIVTALAPPFTMVTNLLEGQCLRGLSCHQSDTIKCCYGLTIDLLSYVARELNFRFDLYVSHDGLFGRRNGNNGTWNGIIGELVHGHAQLAFAPLSVSSRRAEVIDFTSPYYFGSISFLAAPKLKSEISLLAFLLPFSTNLWIAIFTSLNITAIFVAVYEWFSPFGLNPWGRQRTKNFSIASALWVMWALLCGHLVAFKAPKSWPNKFLINVWGGFSVIFVASYTANIAALIAGLVFHSGVINYQERSLFVQKVGAPSSSAVEHYVQRAHPTLWSHMSRFSLSDIDEGVERLRNGTLDVLIADTPILDYYRATDDGCILQQIGDSISDDTYAVGLTKGHPLKESISRVINNYSSNGLLDILQEKWYGGLPCIKGQDGLAGLDEEISGTPRPLGVASVAGVFCLLGMGVLMGTLILAGEHLFYKYTLPRLRHRPKTSIWRSRNVMFFSQKLYRFINCVELVSPHHAAKELVHTVRQGQITSLFQKSVKRKEHEQIRRRKSKAQFFEMIQEIRRVQQEEKSEINSKELSNKSNSDKTNKTRERSHSKSPLMPSQSPKLNEKYKSTINLSSSSSSSSRNNVLSPINLDTTMKPREFTLSSTNLRARSPLESVGRRLSHGDGGSPPLPSQSQSQSSSSRLSIANNFGGSANLRSTTIDTTTSTTSRNNNTKSPAKRGQSFPVFTTLKLPPPLTIKTSYQQQSKSPLLSPNELTAAIGRKLSREWGSGTLFNISKSNETIDTIQKFNFNDDDIAQASSTIHQVNNDTVDDADADNNITTIKKPVRRARSHENRDDSMNKTDVPSSRLAQPSVGGKFVNEKTKKQLESELKAILTARAHHRDLHPP